MRPVNIKFGSSDWAATYKVKCLFDHMVTWNQVIIQKPCYISPSTTCKLQTWHISDLTSGLPFTKSQVHLIILSRDITWQIRNVISPFHKANHCQIWQSIDFG